MGDGNGWTICAFGHRHWGRLGAAGLLVKDGGQVILQHRADWTHEGGTWALPGGARDSHEDCVAAALREAEEEAAISPAAVVPYGYVVDDHGSWSYTTVLARPRNPIQPRVVNAESQDVRWWAAGDVDRLPKHPGFATAWVALRDDVAPVMLVIDAANVIGSRADGWWRDRAGATRRLLGRLRSLAVAGIPASELPEGITVGALTTLLLRITVVVEGSAAAVVTDPPAASCWAARQVTTVAATRDGDTEVLQQAKHAQAVGEQPVVVTADRALRSSLARDEVVVGPSWLYRLLPRG
jgi:8-oxo-dGTP diphosphatase